MAPAISNSYNLVSHPTTARRAGLDAVQDNKKSRQMLNCLGEWVPVPPGVS